jgi:hypothetical protein
MSAILSKIFGMSENKGDPALKQGARFNRMQNTITSAVYPQLPLMDQTTYPGIGSITESLDNIQSTPLQDQDEKEFEKLGKMQNIYKNLLDQLNTLQKQVNINNNSSHLKTLIEKIKNVNGKIMTQSRKIANLAYKTNDANIRANNERAAQQKKIQLGIKEMSLHKIKLDGMLKYHRGLNGQVQNQQFDLDANYVQYIIWFLAMSTIMVVTVKQLGK